MLAQLFDNRSVQSLLASHIALLGPMPMRLISDGQLSEFYFTGQVKPDKQTLIGKHEGRICRLFPTSTSLEALCERHGCTDSTFPEFIRALLKMDPNERSSASDALKLPFFANAPPGACPPYKLAAQDKSGEAGIRLLEKYKSLENVESPSREKSGVGSFGNRVPSFNDALADDDVPGPATPTSFREQCYLDRERLEKKRSRKSGIARWASGGGSGGGGAGGGDLPNMDQMMISPKTPASGAEPPKKTRES